MFLLGGPIGKEYAGKPISRTIEIRGDQTLAALHAANFQAYDRWEEHLSLTRGLTRREPNG